jgi:Spy/CpxP family protein refolding chaperone
MKRTLLAVAAALMVTATLLAQGVPAGPPGGKRPNPLTGLKNALGLTDAQVQEITSLAQTEKTRVQAIMADIRQKRQALNTLLNTSSPNPNDVAINSKNWTRCLPPGADGSFRFQAWVVQVFEDMEALLASLFGSVTV